MPLIKNGRAASDPWVFYADDAPLQPDIPAVVSLPRFRAERAGLVPAGLDLGVRVAPQEGPEALADDLHRLGLVELDFPAFTDGRGYSTARLLRQRYGYTGEIRAVGQVLRDQALFMLRAGINAFQIPAGETADDWLAAIAAVRSAYQPASDGRAPIWYLRAKRAAAAQ
ncbi:MAG: DUF934 domain-containing protein [Marivibrio sp.]|uniref:DUF934 domain-containing protein n=1 Tax=Marivibrio sp. TaxID=2039719 RepID=UPI0032EBE56E